VCFVPRVQESWAGAGDLVLVGTMSSPSDWGVSAPDLMGKSTKRGWIAVSNMVYIWCEEAEKHSNSVCKQAHLFVSLTKETKRVRLESVLSAATMDIMEERKRKKKKDNGLVKTCNAGEG